MTWFATAPGEFRPRGFAVARRGRVVVGRPECVEPFCGFAETAESDEYARAVTVENPDLGRVRDTRPQRGEPFGIALRVGPAQQQNMGVQKSAQRGALSIGDAEGGVRGQRRFNRTSAGSRRRQFASAIAR